MTGTLKGLFKGLRYFSQIFDSKEQEMQIGVPTDVKHVAHIGWDGTSSNPPSWMDGFKSVPEIANEPSNPLKESKKTAKKLASEGTQDSTNDKPKNKMRRKTATGNESPINSPKHRSDGTKQPRHHSTSNSTLDSSKGNQKLNLSIESSSPNPNGIPKQSRRKKVKATCDRSSKSSGCHLRTENEGQRRTD